MLAARQPCAYWCLQNEIGQQLDFLARCLVLRALLDVGDVVPEELRSLRARGKELRAQATCESVVSGMGCAFVCLASAATSRATKAVVVANKQGAFYNLVLLSTLGTQAAAELLLGTGAATDSDDLHEKILEIRRRHRGNPAALVDDTVQAGAVLKRRLLGVNVKAAWQRLLDTVPANPAKPAMKRGPEWRAKSGIMQDLKKALESLAKSQRLHIRKKSGERWDPTNWIVELPS
ncbi:unnamed protein product [Symbiodinium sp. CCMP2592]|nr:unnamed protein product [Symbiodinium sp. CCMP2592]